MKYDNAFPLKISETPDMGIVLPDGMRLSARVWLPEDAESHPVPVILEYLPYRKRDGTVARDEMTHPWFAGQGYACVRVDMRGNGDSQGLMEDEYTTQELQDACDVIAWLAEQAWCDGSVGMMGISWGGFNGLQVASLRPPALKAIITLCSAVDRYADDIHYKGGSLLGANVSWASQMLSYSSRPPDPELVGGGKWLDLWKYRLEHQPWHWEAWHSHQHRDAYWKHGSICEDYSTIQAAVLSIGGWHDGYRNTISHLVENLEAPVKGIVGPWIHKYPHFAGPKPAIGFLQEARRWWDRWLKGADTGVEQDPDYRVWLMDSLDSARWWDERPGRWIAEEEWPSPRIGTETLYLTKAGLRSDAGSLDAKIASPQDCGQAAGEYFPFAYSQELPDEQSHDDKRSLCCDGESLETSLDIVGAARFRARLACNRPEGQICVRLCDVGPDGASAFITHGVFNLTHHTSHEMPQALVPGETIDIDLELDQIAYRMPEGHRLRIAISNAYWPFLWPSSKACEVSIEVATVDIPVRPSTDGDEWKFEVPIASGPWKHDVLRPACYERGVSVEPETGEVVTLISQDDGENRDVELDLVSGSWSRHKWSIHPDDPCSATAEIEREQTGGREGQMWRTEAVVKMWCDVDYYYSTATLRCWLNHDLFFDKAFRNKVERKLV